MVRIRFPPAESLSLSRSCCRGSGTPAFRAAGSGAISSAARAELPPISPWKIIVWVALEVLWFVALFAVLGLFERALR